MVLSDLDRTLISRCLSGADGAWEDFVDRYIALITHVVASAGRIRLGELPDQWRDDLVAEVLLALVDDDFAVLRRFRGQSSLGTYLVVVARRVAARKLGKMRHGTPKRLDAEPAAPEVSDLPLDSEEEVGSLLEHLPDPEAQAIRMFHFEHRSYRDIGLHIGIPENSVGPLLSKARQRMRSARP